MFGSRIHGNIAGLIAGTPSFVLSHDSRTLELARYFDIPNLPLAEVGVDVDPRALYERADYAALLAGHAARRSAFTAFLDAHGISSVYAEGAPAPFSEATLDVDRAVIDGSSGVAIRRRRRSLQGRIRRRLRRSRLGRLVRVAATR